MDLQAVQYLLDPKWVVEQHIAIDNRDVLCARDRGDPDPSQVFLAPADRICP